MLFLVCNVVCKFHIRVSLGGGGGVLFMMCYAVRNDLVRDVAIPFNASVTEYKPFGSPIIGEFLFPVMKWFLGKGND